MPCSRFQKTWVTVLFSVATGNMILGKQHSFINSKLFLQVAVRLDHTSPS